MRVPASSVITMLYTKLCFAMVPFVALLDATKNHAPSKPLSWINTLWRWFCFVGVR
ncbi:hypothetical protein D3C78_1595080 [compost metagenome]